VQDGAVGGAKIRVAGCKKLQNGVQPAAPEPSLTVNKPSVKPVVLSLSKNRSDQPKRIAADPPVGRFLGEIPIFIYIQEHLYE
jgi:hypothetical protein